MCAWRSRPSPACGGVVAGFIARRGFKFARLLRAHTLAHPRELAELIIRDNLSARDVESLLKSKNRPKKAQPQQEKSAEIKALEIRARTELGLSMRLDWDEKNYKGQVSVKVTSLEQLEDLLAKIGLAHVK